MPGRHQVEIGQGWIGRLRARAADRERPGQDANLYGLTEALPSREEGGQGSDERVASAGGVHNT